MGLLGVSVLMKFLQASPGEISNITNVTPQLKMGAADLPLYAPITCLKLGK